MSWVLTLVQSCDDAICRPVGVSRRLPPFVDPESQWPRCENGFHMTPSTGFIEAMSWIGPFLYLNTTDVLSLRVLCRGFVFGFWLTSHLISFIPIYERDIPLKDESIGHKHTHER
jgi:hypothetical protein